MAAHSQSSGKIKNANVGGETEEKPTTFHDFLSNKGPGNESAPAAVDGCRPEVSPSSATDLSSVVLERNAGNHLEGIPYYGSRGDDTAGLGSSNRFTGFKRSNSDSFMISSRDKFRNGPPDSQDSPLLTKLLRYSGGEHPRRTRDEETPYSNMHHTRPISASFISQSSTGGRTDNNNNNNLSKWDRATAVNPGPVLQYPPRSGHVIPFGYQGSSNRFKEANVGPSSPIVIQTAADEGSRTGIKGSGILSSINASGFASGRQPAGVLVRSGKQKSGVSISEPESSSHRGTESGSRQMTIFYGGQAHVFDNVYPNKADVIMALAGSNGGSWSATCKPPNSAAKPSTGENDALTVAIFRELHAGQSSDK